MTGEITLRGHVLPVGGIRDKILAAHRAGLKVVIIPKRNEKDLIDIAKKVLNELQIIKVETIDEVLHVALTAPEVKPYALLPRRKRSPSRRHRPLRTSLYSRIARSSPAG